ncbi:2-phosphosulfolactate phosphatase [Aneurinibacillus thermoaerophilus]|uniref:2-phosphosulfolactate phosphatase n=1 Tax=Aneurinibacillus thermoaerophilus TaxID=143495 RepID=UPI002E1EB98A|nr:2-phosphosulfolactate phosphatase [Aneurinibacillus thermoaerophilus]
MEIQTVQTVAAIRPEQMAGRTVIVIDVLRASSTIVTAFNCGFASVIPVETSEQAYALRSSDTVLAGERHCKKIADFDYNNSPTAVRAGKHTGKHLVLTTTNGTRAIQKTKKAKHVLIGCFLNALACIEEALNKNCNITLYCAGTRGEFALEDGLAAGLMVHLAKKRAAAIHTCDVSEALEACYLQMAPQLPERLLTTTTGRRLVQHQYTEDILYCGQIDLLKIVPIVREKRILSSVSS